MLKSVLIVCCLVYVSLGSTTKYFYPNETEEKIFNEMTFPNPNDLYWICTLANMTFPCPFNSTYNCTVQNYSFEYSDYLEENPD